MKDLSKPDKRRKFDAAFRAEALRLAEQCRSNQAVAWALNIDPKRIHQWQKAARTPVAFALGPALDPDTAAGARAGNFKKSHHHLLGNPDPMRRYRFIAAARGHYPVLRRCHMLGVPASGYYAWQADRGGQ